METQNISATIEKRLLGKLDQWAEEAERNRSWMINKAIEIYLEELEDLKIARERMKDERISTTTLRKMIGV